MSSLPERAKFLLLTAAVGLLYFLSARLGLLLAYENTNVSPVWPPSGLALALVLLFGFRISPGIFAGAFAANFVVFTQNNVAGITPTFFVSLAIATGNMLEAITGGYLLKRFIGNWDELNKPPNVLTFVLLDLLMCSVSSTIGVTSISLAGISPWNLYGTLWFTWLLGDASGILHVMPLILAWYANPSFPRNRGKIIEGIAAFAFLILLGNIIFINVGSFPLISSRLYLIFPFFLWFAYRFSHREVLTALFILVGMAVYGAILGKGPFVEASLYDSLMQLISFISIMSITFMTLSAALSENREVMERLRRKKDAMEKTNRDLKRAMNKLEQSNKRLEEFAHVATHNLRAPTTNLISMIELYETEREEIYLEKIHQTANRLNTYLNDLINLVIVSQPAEDIREIQFATVFEEVKKSIENMITSSGTRFEIDFSGSPSIHYSSAHLHSIFQNLITNAIKYTFPGRPPVIRISTQKEDSFVCLSVTDNGIGIDLERHGEKLFKPFNRLQKDNQGKGLGLYIVKSQVESDGGKIEVKSKPGTGTTFILHLRNLK